MSREPRIPALVAQPLSPPFLARRETAPAPLAPRLGRDQAGGGAGVPRGGGGGGGGGGLGAAGRREGDQEADERQEVKHGGEEGKLVQGEGQLRSRGRG
jgi:hypothetical protein